MAVTTNTTTTARDLQTTARVLYGDDLPVAQYIRKLAAELKMSESGVKKIWYFQRGKKSLSKAVRNRLTDRLNPTA
jgi:glucose-6-phosphate-specific signal transduction histidine kinase